MDEPMGDVILSATRDTHTDVASMGRGLDHDPGMVVPGTPAGDTMVPSVDEPVGYTVRIAEPAEAGWMIGHGKVYPNREAAIQGVDRIGRVLKLRGYDAYRIEVVGPNGGVEWSMTRYAMRTAE